MYRLNKIVLIVVAIATMIPSALFAQDNGNINTFSPYSMYGLGELQTQGTVKSRSMGGVGVASRSGVEINLLNPASYSASLRKSSLFNYGVEGANYFNSYQGKKNAYSTINFHDIALQLPLAKGLGMAFSVSPFSSVGYEINSSSTEPNIGYINYAYKGVGDVTLVKLGVGYELFKNFSIGASLNYYWGGIERTFSMTPLVITGNGTYYTTSGENSYSVSKIKAQVGAQWSPIYNKKERLTVGATYDIGGSLSPESSFVVVGDGSVVGVVAAQESGHLSIVLPSQLAGGVTYQNVKWTLSGDYVYQNWHTQNQTNVEYTSSGSAVEYNNFGTVKLGGEYIPRASDVRNYFNRVGYRAGLRYGGYQQSFGGEQLTQFAVTAGFGFPLKMGGISKIDLGLEYGSRSGSKAIVNQRYAKISLGFTLFGDDYWFQRPKFD